MAKGNKILNVFEKDGWKNAFYNSVGSYVNYINQELSKTYPLEPLSNYIRIAGGYAFKTSFYKEEGIPIIRISDFNNEKIDLSNCVFYEEDKSLAKYELKENDIVICLTGGTIGKLGIVQSGLGKLYLNQRVGKFEVLEPDDFENEYVYWIARSVQNTIKNLAWGAAIPNVSPKQIEEIKFPIPEKSIQKKIINFLNDLKDNSVENKIYFNEEIENTIIEIQNTQIKIGVLSTEYQTQTQLLSQLRQSILQEAIQGKLTENWRAENPNTESAEILLQRIKTEKEKTAKTRKKSSLPEITESEIPFELPENWVWCRLGEICSKTGSGSTPNGGKSVYTQSGIKFIRSQNVYNDGLILEEIAYITEVIHQSMSGTIVLPNDLLLNITGGSIGRCCIIPSDFDEANINQHVAIVRLIEPILNSFVHKVICSTYFQKEIINVQTGAGREGLPKNKMDLMLIPLPPLSEQHAIVEQVEKLLGKCTALQTEIENLNTHSKTLLKALFAETFSNG